MPIPPFSPTPLPREVFPTTDRFYDIVNDGLIRLLALEQKLEAIENAIVYRKPHSGGRGGTARSLVPIMITSNTVIEADLQWEYNWATPKKDAAGYSIGNPPAAFQGWITDTDKPAYNTPGYDVARNWSEDITNGDDGDHGSQWNLANVPTPDIKLRPILNGTIVPAMMVPVMVDDGEGGMMVVIEPWFDKQNMPDGECP